MSKYITHEDLAIVMDLILEKNVESCGFLIEDEENRLRLYIEKYGSIEDGRGVCQLSKYTKYIWHTHTSQLIAYPSPQDIYTILKFHTPDNYPYTSIVFTLWGIWEISFPHKKFILDKNWLEYLHEITDTVFHGIWNVTDGGKVIKRNTELFIESAIQSLIYNINSEKVFDNAFDMKFTSWKNVKKNYFLKN